MVFDFCVWYMCFKKNIDPFCVQFCYCMKNNFAKKNPNFITADDILSLTFCVLVQYYMKFLMCTHVFIDFIIAIMCTVFPISAGH